MIRVRLYLVSLIGLTAMAQTGPGPFTTAQAAAGEALYQVH
jgi:hypothetical protein